MLAPTGRGSAILESQKKPLFNVTSDILQGDLPGSHEELVTMYRALQADYSRRTIALAAAAHELKTPVAIWQGYTDLLLTEKMGPLSPAQREILQEMQSNRLRLQQFVDDFLNYAAMETGKLKLEMQDGDIVACLKEVCAVWMPRYEDKRVALYHLDKHKIQPFLFDYCKVQHVVANLLHNALKFTPSQGTVWVMAEPCLWERRCNRAGSVTIDRRNQPTEQPNSVRITVSDTGIGISPELQSEIFDDFFHSAPPGMNAEGIGLGLAIARRLVQALGGKIWVESLPSSGSKVSFFLPFKANS